MPTVAATVPRLAGPAGRGPLGRQPRRPPVPHTLPSLIYPYLPSLSLLSRVGVPPPPPLPPHWRLRIPATRGHKIGPSLPTQTNVGGAAKAGEEGQLQLAAEGALAKGVGQGGPAGRRRAEPVTAHGGG